MSKKRHVSVVTRCTLRKPSVLKLNACLKCTKELFMIPLRIKLPKMDAKQKYHNLYM